MQSILFSFIFKWKVPNFLKKANLIIELNELLVHNILKKVNLIIELNELLLINFFYKDAIAPRI